MWETKAGNDGSIKRELNENINCPQSKLSRIFGFFRLISCSCVCYVMEMDKVIVFIVRACVHEYE